MDKHTAYIKNRLRPPQTESLEILAGIADILPLKKNADLAAELEKVLKFTGELATANGSARVFTEFERTFPCVCFALATGVGKTRLMGVFIAWLNQAKGIKNFFVLAPNLTIYNKLIEDFSNPRSPKYVFPGIGDFVHRPPGIITGDNYNSKGTLPLFDESININVFNISKINSETRGGKQPRIKRLSEYIGQSYFDHLANLDDLVILMEIPRIVIQSTDEVDSGFRDFDLDTKSLNYPPVAEEILIQYLNRKENAQETLIGKYGISADKPENLILNELINFSEIDYDSQAELLQKLVGQAIAKLNSYLNEEEFINVVKYHKREIANLVYSQMRPNFYCNTKSFDEPIAKPFTQIEGHNLTKIQQDNIHHHTDTIAPTSAIPQKVFSGFKKACHTLYKFDAKGEKDFATILENDKDVIKWLRPAPKQFKIYWDHNARTYEPDFVVETGKTVYLTEIKADNQMTAEDVQEKAKAAVQYCKHATDHNLQNGGKEWKYLLIPHSEVLPNMSLGYLAQKRIYRV